MLTERYRIRFSLSILPLLLLSCGWCSVYVHRSLEASTVEPYQKAQLEVVRRLIHRPQIELVPWRQPITPEARRESAAWSPVVISRTDREWLTESLTDSSAKLPLMGANESYAQLQTSIFAMSAITVVLLALLVTLRRNRTALEASEAHYRAIVEDQMEMICRFRCDGKLTFVNQAYANTFGVSPGNLAGANVFDLIPQTELPKVLSQLAALSPDCPVHISERRIITSNQQLQWQQWTDRAIVNSRGQVVEIQSVGRDITERKLYEAEIERLAFTDPLTGLANRRRLYDVGQHHLNSEKLHQTALIYLDLDRFKPINDTLGHDAGDELLIQVAERLRSCIRKGDVLARLGGDEFAILLVNSELKDAQMVGDRILVALSQSFYLCGHTIHLGGSLGIATTTLADMPFSQLLTQADIAMYRAKSQGRGSYVIFDANLYAETLSRRELEVDLRQVIEQNQLCVYYQPIVCLSTYEVLGFEAVVRWQHPHRGLLVPADFLAIAEELGVSLDIERWVIQHACCQLAAWQSRHQINPSLMVSVNISGKLLAQPNAVNSLEALLDRTKLAPHTLMLEITEDIVIQQPDLALAVLGRLRGLGIQIGLDNFGTGYSSLSYLHRFPVDILKIDRSFVQTLQDNKNSEIVHTILTLAKSLNTCTVAEGIETPDQLAQLRTLHCRYGQGYFFAEPLNPVAAEDFLQRYSQELKI